MAALPDSTWRENTATLAENKIAEYLSIANTPHGADAATHARHVREAEDFATDFRANTLPGILALEPARTAISIAHGSEAQAQP